MGIDVPWVGRSKYHGLGDQNTMVSRMKIQSAVDRGINIPCVAVKITWVGESKCHVLWLNVPWVGKSEYHGYDVRYNMDSGSMDHGYGIDIRWIGVNIPWVEWLIFHG